MRFVREGHPQQVHRVAVVCIYLLSIALRAKT